MRLAYATAIFLGAFLLFQVQPLVAKFALPWYGGAPGVWTTCLLFFQAVLVAGYAYAHWTTQRLKPKAQAWLHLALIAAALATLPIVPSDRWKPDGSTNPVPSILALLAGCVGVPYFVLSSTGPLLQRWFHTNFPTGSPYRLYALSNVGSLLALVSFPFLLEPRLTRLTQAKVWEGGFVLYALTCGYCAWKHAANAPGASAAVVPEPSSENATPPTLLQKLLWLLLPAAASVMLLATTNKLCQDVAVIPFLWVAPLSIYLITFVLCFEGEGWYRRIPYTVCFAVAIAGLSWALTSGGDWPIRRQLLTYGTGLFISCMVCHGELYRLRPAPSQLTGYYLCVAGGGALGGFFVAVIAPLLFTNYYELHAGMVGCAVLLVLICAVEGTRILPTPGPIRGWAWLAIVLPVLAFGALDFGFSRSLAEARLLSGSHVTLLRTIIWGFVLVVTSWWIWRVRRGDYKHWRLLACAWLVLGTIALAGTLWSQAHTPNPDRVFRSRNFYGVLTVYEHRRTEPGGRHLLLQHGRITHGLQFLDPAQATWPTTYYGGESGVGLALDCLESTNRHIGLVGLGTGTLVAYARLGDRFTVYEINPDVVQLAQTRFNYLQNCAGRVQIVPGDARLSMERQPAQDFDLLALDAFSGDAIPVHLLTREAFQLYERHIKANGVIAVHISNHFLDLAPVVLRLADEFGYYSAVIDYDETPETWWLYSSTWILLTHDSLLLETPEISAASVAAPASDKGPLWTDDFTSLFQILK